MGALVGPGMSTPLIMATKKQRTAALMRRAVRWSAVSAVPVNSIEEGLVPNNGEDDQTSDEGDDVLRSLAAERVAIVGGRLREVGDAEEMKVEGEWHEHHGADQAEEGEQGKKTEVAEMGDAFFAGDEWLRVDGEEGLAEDLFSGGTCGEGLAAPIQLAAGVFRFAGPFGGRCRGVFECEGIGGRRRDVFGCEGILGLVGQWLGECAHARTGFLLLDFLVGLILICNVWSVRGVVEVASSTAVFPPSGSSGWGTQYRCQFERDLDRS